MSRTNSVVVREYKNPRAYQRDARRYAERGYTVASTAERGQRPGLIRVVLTGGLALLFRPKPHIVVTYQRAAAS